MSKRSLFILSVGMFLVVIAVFISLFTFDIITPAEKYLTVRAPHPIPWMLRGVVLDLGSPGEPDDKSIESPAVVKLDDGFYAMWYRGQSRTDKIGRIMYATSEDGLSWTKKGVVMTPTEGYEEDKVDPMTVIYENNMYKMWYGGQAYGGCACYATSPDGIVWTKYAGNPVLKKTSGIWDNSGAGGQHKVIKSGTNYVMYYKGYGSDDPGWVFYGRAESPDGIHWAKKGKTLTPDPVIGDSIAFRNLAAFRVDDHICLAYAMADNLHIFLASGKDGITFAKHGLLFLNGQTPGGYDEKWATSPCFIVEENRVRMWYEAGDINGRVRIAHAEVYKDQFKKAFKRAVLPSP